MEGLKIVTASALKLAAKNVGDLENKKACVEQAVLSFLGIGLLKRYITKVSAPTVLICLLYVLKPCCMYVILRYVLGNKRGRNGVQSLR